MSLRSMGGTWLMVLLIDGLGILAQTTEAAAAAPGWLSVIIQLGSFGLVAYLIVRGLPALQKDIQAERTLERADFARTIEGEQKEFAKLLEAMAGDRRQERLDFASALKVMTDHARTEAEAVRRTSKEEVEGLRATFHAEQRDTRVFYANEAAEMRKIYMDAVAAMRTAVHDVRDVASATVNKANVALEVARVNKQGGTS